MIYPNGFTRRKGIARSIWNINQYTIKNIQCYKTTSEQNIVVYHILKMEAGILQGCTVFIYCGIIIVLMIPIFMGFLGTGEQQI